MLRVETANVVRVYQPLISIHMLITTVITEMSMICVNCDTAISRQTEITC